MGTLIPQTGNAGEEMESTAVSLHCSCTLGPPEEPLKIRMLGLTPIACALAGWA